MNKKLIIITFMLLMFICAEGKKISGSRSSGSGRGSSRKSSKPHPAPTSFSYPQPSAPKPTLFGWQEKPAQKTQTLSSWQSKPSSGQSHSYPSSQTGLSGHSQPKQPPNYQESVQRNNAHQNLPAQQTPSRTNNQPSHSYPSSNGLSGNAGSGPPQSGSGHIQQHGSGYPQQGGTYPQQQTNGLSGSGGAPPPYSERRPADANRPYNGGSYQSNNYGNQYHPQGPPPPYSIGSNYGGYGSHGGYNPGYSPQMPGYFGNYANNGKGFGGVSRTGSALTGVGIAGAGVGTLLTGLALWNLARSTGHNRHTVIYDNRGQPVAVAPANNTSPAVDPMLADLVNCTLTINNDNATEVLAIPCAIATSFTPDANVQNLDANANAKDNTKCTVTVITKTGKEYMTTIPCSILLSTAAENNVTEPPLIENAAVGNNTMVPAGNGLDLIQPSALNLTSEGTDGINTSMNCMPQPGDIRDPINPCFSVTHNLTVIPIPPTTPTNIPKS